MSFIKKTISYYKKDIIIFLITFIPFLLALFLFYPGILTYDSYYQLNQITTFQFDNWHPFLHTFIELICYKIGGVAGIAFFQILFISILWTIICHYNRKQSKKFIPILLASFFLVLNPLNLLTTITLWKDVFYSFLILLVTFLLQIIIDRNYKCSTKFIIIFSVSLAFLMSLRLNGIIILVLLLPILIFLFYRKDKEHKSFIKLPVFFGLVVVSIMLLNPIFQVKENEKSAVASKVMQGIGAFAYLDLIEDSDQELINTCIPYETLKQVYNPQFSDPIYAKLDEDAMLENQFKFFSMFFKYSLKYPTVMLNYVKDTTMIVWDPTLPDNMIGTTITLGDNRSFFEHELYLQANEKSDLYKTVESFLTTTNENSILKMILYSPAFYLYLTIILSIFLVKWKGKKYLVLLLPNLFNIVSVIPSLPVQDVRYLYGNFLIFYYLFVIVFCARKKKEVKKDA